MTGRRTLVVEADGGSRGNPGPAGYGAVVVDPATDEVVAEVAEAIGRATNNVAEYRGLIAGLRAAVGVDPACVVEVRMDSKLVVEQMSGRWQIKHDDMRRLAAQARGILPADRVTYRWVPRADNTRADRLANAAMDAAAAGRAWSSTTSTTSTTTASTTSSSVTSSSVTSVRASASATVTAGARPDSARAPRGPDLGEPTVLVLVRHGRTVLTEQRRFSGSGGADPELSEAGARDAERAAALLAELKDGVLPDVPPPSALVCSPLARTRQTARIIGDRLGLVAVPDDAWAETGFGAWDGLTYEEVAARWPDELRAWQGSTSAAPPDGESLDEHVLRIRAARAALVAGHPARTVAVVTHVTPVRVVVQEALDAGPAALWRTRIGPCSVTAARYWPDGGVEVLAVNRAP